MLSSYDEMRSLANKFLIPKLLRSCIFLDLTSAVRL
jgi:hypothetical protein